MKKAVLQKKTSTVYKVAPQRRTADDRKWDKSFAGSHDLLKQLANEAIADHRAGRTRPIDPDRM